LYFCPRPKRIRSARCEKLSAPSRTVQAPALADLHQVFVSENGGALKLLAGEHLLA
jgi:hypothetical protein